MGTTTYPPAGSMKSVQRGKFAVGASSGATATVAAVNMAKSRLSFLGSQSGRGYIELSNSTTITGNNAGNADSTTFSWELREEY